MAWSLSHRLGHFRERALRKPAGLDREPAGIFSRADGIGELCGRCDWKDDQPADDCCGDGGDWYVGCGSVEALSVYVAAQRCAGDCDWRSGDAVCIFKLIRSSLSRHVVPSNFISYYDIICL